MSTSYALSYGDPLWNQSRDRADALYHIRRSFKQLRETISELDAGKSADEALASGSA